MPFLVGGEGRGTLLCERNLWLPCRPAVPLEPLPCDPATLCP